MTTAVQKISLSLSRDIPFTKPVLSPPRDLSELGMERLLVTPFSRFRRGTPIRLGEGVLFTTYATLRAEERGGKISRVQQIVEWLGSDFDRVIVFDEGRAEVLAKVIDRVAIVRVAEREAA